MVTTLREKRTGNNLYQELSFQEPDALGEIDEGADLTGAIVKLQKVLSKKSNLFGFFYKKLTLI